MANNELSGPPVTIYLADWLISLSKRRYTYRIIFIPETIGWITYLSRHLDPLKAHVIAGLNITCVGDERAHSYLPSRAENTISDQVAKHELSGLIHIMQSILGETDEVMKDNTASPVLIFP